MLNYPFFSDQGLIRIRIWEKIFPILSTEFLALFYFFFPPLFPLAAIFSLVGLLYLTRNVLYNLIIYPHLRVILVHVELVNVTKITAAINVSASSVNQQKFDLSILARD